MSGKILFLLSELVNIKSNLYLECCTIMFEVAIVEEDI